MATKINSILNRLKLNLTNFKPTRMPACLNEFMYSMNCRWIEISSAFMRKSITLLLVLWASCWNLSAQVIIFAQDEIHNFEEIKINTIEKDVINAENATVISISEGTKFINHNKFNNYKVVLAPVSSEAKIKNNKTKETSSKFSKNEATNADNVKSNPSKIAVKTKKAKDSLRSAMNQLPFIIIINNFKKDLDYTARIEIFSNPVLYTALIFNNIFLVKGDFVKYSMDRAPPTAYL